MNLLLINYEYPPIGGGAGNATHFMSKALVKQGHEVTVLTTGWENNVGHSLDQGVHLYCLNAWRSDPSAASTLEKLHFIWKAKSALPKILQQRNIEAAIIYFTIPCGLLASQLGNIPYVISLRGGDVPGLVPEIQWIHNLILPWRRKILSKAKAIIANAEGLADLSIKADPFPVDIIPNGVDIEFFKPNPTAKKDSSQTEFLFVGRFHPQKNLHILLEQLSKLKQESSKPFKLHLVGSGPLEDDLKQHSLQLNLNENIQWHGWLNKEALRNLHQRANVFINPSHYEGLPNAVLEAMASGLIIVVSDIPGNHDLISGGAGYVYDHRDTQDLYNNLQAAHENPNLEFSQTARKRAEKKYSWQYVAKRYADLFS
jgi:glycosyltransferase involved in cell wall biosynthesis